jgi:hypothetical protein
MSTSKEGELYHLERTALDLDSWVSGLEYDLNTARVKAELAWYRYYELADQEDEDA